MFKALTFRPASIGDALMGKYFLENIRAQYPKARLAIVVGSRASLLRDLFAGEPWLEVVEANRRNLPALMKMWQRWRGSEIALTNYTAGTLNLPAKLMGRLLAKRGSLAGFDDDAFVNHFLYDFLLPRPIRDRSVRLHECDALSMFRIPISVNRLSLKYLPIAGVAEKFNIHRPYIIVHLFSGSRTRGLSIAHMRELVSALAKRMPDTTLVLSGGAGDVAEALDVAQKHPAAVVIAGRATLQEMMNLIADSRIVISLDTGVGHLAAHIGRPPIILSTCLGRISWWGHDQYGPSIPAALFTRADHCVGGHVFKSYPDCLATIDMDAVAAEASSFL